tara:strand:- start:67 stop:924 length:858 start_codon:yes stop_codon:yes gene_type:complete
MKISIIIPTYNNLEYLKFLLLSIKENSNFLHDIIIHINDGSDGTLEHVIENNIRYTHSNTNIGLCSSLNKAASLCLTDFILYAHDDMFFCKNWDIFLSDEVKKSNNNLFYLTGTNISAGNGLINYNCGNTPKNFDRIKFDTFCETSINQNFQGSHWAPHLIHKELWDKVGGFSEEFNPGDGSDPDLCMKLWLENVRVFKCISKFKVYHFSSITTRKSNVKLNNGTKQFLLKWGFNPKFFRKYYLRGDYGNIYKGPLDDPNFTSAMLVDLIINKIKFYYYKIFNDK